MKNWEELNLIRSIRALAGKKSKNVVVGIGDDTAVIKASPHALSLYTVDSIVEGIHFPGMLNRWTSAGRRAIGAAVSDIAAMGGRPLYTMLSLFLPEHFDEGRVQSFVRGFMGRVREYGMSLIGGNITTTRGSFAADTVVIGTVYRGRFVGRSGARIGDLVCMAGVTGEAMAGFDLLMLGKEKGYPGLVKKYLEPSPMLKESMRVCNSLAPHSMIDVSDGLLQDLRHILDESAVGAVIELDRVPVSREVASAARLMRKSPYDYVLAGGDDYVLLFTVAEKRYKESAGGTRIYRIGRITKKEGIEFLRGGKRIDLNLKAGGYVHRG